MPHTRWFWASLCLGLLTIISAPEAGAQARRADREPYPAIYRQRNEWRLDLPVAIEDALDRYNRDFEPWSQANYRQLDRSYDYSSRQTPWAVIGDFNGDGRMDVAIAGRTEDELVVLMVLSNGKRSYRVVELETDPFDPEDRRTIRPSVLQYLYPGRYVINDPRLFYPRELLLQQPAVQVTGNRRPGPTLYAVEGNKVVPYFLSDQPAGKPRRTPSKGPSPRPDKAPATPSDGK